MFELEGNYCSKEEICRWYLEEEKYHNQFKGGLSKEYWVIYETFNYEYAFKRFANFKKENKVLSFGCAEGNDLKKNYEKYNFKLFGIEASDELIKTFKKNFPQATIKKANIYGNINFKDNFFDYIIILGVLHHIPNVSFVLNELYRVLKIGGRIIIREPISSMRPKNKISENDLISPNERGIPIGFMKNELEKLDLKILSISKAYYAPLIRFKEILKFFQKMPFFVYCTDKLCCSLPFPNKYYRENIFLKCAPGSAYYITEK